MSLDLRMAQAHGLPPVAAAHPTFTAPTTSAPSVADRVDSATSSRPAVAAARTNQQTLDYIQAVAERVGQLRTSDEIPIVMASIPSAVKS
jgi:hypothetical protein